MASDFFGTTIEYQTGNQTIERQLNVGACLILSGNAFPWGNEFRIACDLHDFQNAEKYNDYVERFHFGIEGDWIIYCVRAGLYQGYPSFGIERSSDKTRIEYAFYGQELGLYPGHIPSWNHTFTVSFKFGSDLVKGASPKSRVPAQKRQPYPAPYGYPPPRYY